jgi:hypothetical protein
VQANEPPPETTGPSIYNDRVVAYLDLLGFSNLVRNGHPQDALAALEQVRQTQRRAAKRKEETPEWVDFSMFSDSVACSIDLKNGDQDILVELRAWALVNFTRSFYLALLERGVLARGAIVRGELFHRDPIVFGPALVAAHDDETRAIYPRILVDAEVVRLASTLSTGKILAPPEAMFKRDKDGTFVIRMFAPHAKLTKEEGLAREIFYPRYLKVARQLRENAPNKKVEQKLDWLVADIEEDQREFGDLVSRLPSKHV